MQFDHFLTKKHKKYFLLCHLIFSTKYRRNIFSNNCLDKYIKELLKRRFKGFEILICETDKNHIHFLISYQPDISISYIVQQLKSYTTYHLWLKFNNILKTFYWKRRVLWTKAYFECSIGNASPETIKKIYCKPRMM